jgi:hypothetical protein
MYKMLYILLDKIIYSIVLGVSGTRPGTGEVRHWALSSKDHINSDFRHHNLTCTALYPS